MRDDDEVLCIIIASMVLMVVFGGIITAINIFTSPVDAGETFIAYRAVIYEREIQSTDSESVLTTGCTISDGVDKAKLVRKGVLYLHKKDALKSMENWEKGSQVVALLDNGKPVYRVREEMIETGIYRAGKFYIDGSHFFGADLVEITDHDEFQYGDIESGAYYLQ